MEAAIRCRSSWCRVRCPPATSERRAAIVSQNDACASKPHGRCATGAACCVLRSRMTQHAAHSGHHLLLAYIANNRGEITDKLPGRSTLALLRKLRFAGARGRRIGTLQRLQDVPACDAATC
jgi:hypothetical protein